MSTLLWQLNLFGMWSNTNVCIILTQGLEIINNEQFKVDHKNNSRHFNKQYDMTS